MLADPVDSEDDPVLVEDEDDEDADGVAVLVAADDVTDDVDTVLDAVDVPECVCAATTASAATAAVPTTPNAVVSLLRRRSARSRSATVIRRLGAAITGPPEFGSSVCEVRCEWTGCRGASGAHREDW